MNLGTVCLGVVFVLQTSFGKDFALQYSPNFAAALEYIFFVCLQFLLTINSISNDYLLIYFLQIMYHVYKLGRRGCIALANDFNRFRAPDVEIEKESVRYAKQIEQRWNAFEGLKPIQAASDAQVCLNAYRTGFERH